MDSKCAMAWLLILVVLAAASAMQTDDIGFSLHHPMASDMQTDDIGFSLHHPIKYPNYPRIKLGVRPIPALDYDTLENIPVKEKSLFAKPIIFSPYIMRDVRSGREEEMPDPFYPGLKPKDRV